MTSALRLLSADSHVAEPPHLYERYLDPAFRDHAPYLQYDEKRGDSYIIPGHPLPVPLALICAAGKDPRNVRITGLAFKDMYPGSHDAAARLKDQDVDGISGELLFPTLGMVMASHPDSDYKRACFQAYNRWLSEEFCAYAPARLFGMGQLQIDGNVDRVIADARKIKDQGLVGVMIPAAPLGRDEKDYDHADFDPVWEALASLGLPVAFHVEPTSEKRRGSHLKIMGFQQVVRVNQDLISLFTFGGVFERHPRLKMLSVEADAGWLPHLMFRMDHAYDFGRFWMRQSELARRPSDYVRDQVYLTFQDDFTAFQFKDYLNVERLLWATDFPHSDSTWPQSREKLRRMTEGLVDERELALVTGGNLVNAFNLRLQ